MPHAATLKRDFGVMGAKGCCIISRSAWRALRVARYGYMPHR